MTDIIIANIEQRLQQAQAEIKQLQDARKVLANGPKSTPAPNSRRTRTQPAKPAPQVVPAGKLVSLLARAEGMTTSELAKATNGDQSQVLALLKEQEADGQVRRSGERRATRWHVITDQDRIAARAAELERQSKRTRARKT
jgi:hypothetical protein